MLVRFLRTVVRLLGTLVTLGLSLLPLSALLVALPALSPDEAVLSDTVRPAKTFFSRWRRRVLALLAGVTVLVALFAFAVQAVDALPLPANGQLAPLAKKALSFSFADVVPDDERPADLDINASWPTAKEMVDTRKSLEEAVARSTVDPIVARENVEKLAKVRRQIEERTPTSARLRLYLNPTLAPWLAKPLWQLLPDAFVQHWPFVLLVVYLTDLALLLLIGKVPLTYNLRYLWVRKRDTALTALAFTLVVTLVVVLLAFVNGMYKLNQETGIPGNVLVLSEGSNDEGFSNLGYGDLTNVERVSVTLDKLDRPLATPVEVQVAAAGADGTLTPLPATATAEQKKAGVRLASKETYFVMSQPVPPKPGERPRRRLLQVRAIQDPLVAAAVHNIELQPGGQWFNRAGVVADADGKTYVQAVLGDGAAGTLGVDAGKDRLGVGDTFRLGDLDWKVAGVMKTGASTFGSEVWVANVDLVTKPFGKNGKYTTLVVRTTGDLAGSRAVAFHLSNRYTQTKLKASAEPDYYADLTKTNEQFLTWIVALASVMAVGGVFGVMNTMFASIAARIKEVGVLRILGFKRWQLLISFMVESLVIAAVGGALGCGLGLLANFFEANSTLSGGNGPGKSVALKLVVDYQTVAAGMLFTVVMGRLGGLVPALSAMRMEILDSLR